MGTGLPHPKPSLDKTKTLWLSVLYIAKSKTPPQLAANVNLEAVEPGRLLCKGHFAISI